MLDILELIVNFFNLFFLTGDNIYAGCNYHYYNNGGYMYAHQQTDIFHLLFGGPVPVYAFTTIETLVVLALAVLVFQNQIDEFFYTLKHPLTEEQKKAKREQKRKDVERAMKARDEMMKQYWSVEKAMRKLREPYSPPIWEKLFSSNTTPPAAPPPPLPAGAAAPQIPPQPPVPPVPPAPVLPVLPPPPPANPPSNN